MVIGDAVVDWPLLLLDSADMFLNLVEVVLSLQSVDGTSHLFQVADMLQNLVEVVRVVRDVVERALQLLGATLRHLLTFVVMFPVPAPEVY